MPTDPEPPQRSRAAAALVPLLIAVLLGAGLGYLVANFGEQIWGGLRWRPMTALVGSACLVVAVLVQFVLHELGHLVAGLLTGYRFSSFQIGGLIWVRQADGRIGFRRLRIPGIGGQCLMAPPPLVDGNYPYVAYNLGGPAANLASALVFGGLALLADAGPARATAALFALVGLLMAVLNVVPLGRGQVHNDGANLRALRGDAAARRALWIQLQVTALSTQGVRLREMPDEWFALPSPDQMRNPVVAVLGPFAASRLLDQHRYPQADALLTDLAAKPAGLMELHRRLVICDKAYCELIGDRRAEVLASLDSPEQRRFTRAMQRFPSVVRTQYASALLAERDPGKAADLRARFEQLAPDYPRPIELVGERELMDHVDSLVGQ